jgi:hypothetical protein
VDSPQKYEQDEFMLRPQQIVLKKSPIKARRDKKISPKKDSPHKYYDPNVELKCSPASKSPKEKASPSMRSVSPQANNTYQTMATIESS